MTRMKDGAVKPASEIFSPEFLQAFADTRYDDGEAAELRFLNSMTDHEDAISNGRLIKLTGMTEVELKRSLWDGDT